MNDAASGPRPCPIRTPNRRICSECHAGGLRAGFLVALGLQLEEKRRQRETKAANDETEHEKGQEPRDSCP